MRVALIQFKASGDTVDNLKRSLVFVHKALSQGAEFVLLPEMFYWRGDFTNRAAVKAASVGYPQKTFKDFFDAARQHKAHILLGSFMEQRAQGKPFNTSILIDANGKATSKYRKIHLFDARIGDKIIHEIDYFAPGVSGARTQLGAWHIGLSICYDLRFPSMYQRYAKAGANVLAVPSCFTQVTGQAHWESLLRARAIENLSYVLAPNQVGRSHAGIAAYGNSMVVDPWGMVIARGSGEMEEIIWANLDRNKIKEARHRLPGIVQ